MCNFSSTNVSILQLGLMRSGYYSGKIDGIYGSETEGAVENFIRDNNISINQSSECFLMDVLDKLMPYLSGYIEHTVAAGDSFYTLSRKYNTTLSAIETANPKVNPYNMEIGSKITIPIGEWVTVTDINYSAFLVRAIVLGISRRYPFAEAVPIGRSVWGKMIYLLKMGKGSKQVFFNAEHHANEWITTPLVLKFFESFAKGYAEGGNVGNIKAEEVFNSVTLFVVAAVNPDGIDIVNENITGNKARQIEELADNYKNIPYPQGWKANANGVDLNLNYPAGWEQARKIKFEQGYTMPGPRDFVGDAPLNQPESECIYNLTVANDFLLTISYHTQGAVIYWKYADYLPEFSQEIGEELSKASCYELEITPPYSANAGYKDWFIQTYNRPGYTVEAGRGENPLPISDFDLIYNENYPLMAQALESVIKLL